MPSSGGHLKHCLVDRRQVKGRLARPGPTFVSRGRGRSEGGWRPVDGHGGTPD